MAWRMWFKTVYRCIAQFGSAPGLGPGGQRFKSSYTDQFDAGWSSLVARWAHNPKVVGSNPAPATKYVGGRKTPQDSGGQTG